MALLRAASAAGLALPGRAASSAEVANFLRDRAKMAAKGCSKHADLRDVTSPNDVPCIKGLQTSSGSSKTP